MTMSEQELAEKMSLCGQLQAQRDALDEQVQELRMEVGTEMILRQTERVEGAEYIAVMTSASTRESLSKQLLLQAGVTAEQLAKGTVVSTVNGTVRISKRRAG